MAQMFSSIHELTGALTQGQNRPRDSHLSEVCTAERVGEYLRGVGSWVLLAKDCASRNEDLSPHRFRHRYAFELGRRGFNDREASTRVGSTCEGFARHNGNKAREDI